MKELKVGDSVQILPDNAYSLKPQVAIIQSFHTENGWKERHGWLWLDVEEVGQLLFWPSEYQVIEDDAS